MTTKQNILIIIILLSLSVVIYIMNDIGDKVYPSNPLQRTVILIIEDEELPCRDDPSDTTCRKISGRVSRAMELPHNYIHPDGYIVKIKATAIPSHVMYRDKYIFKKELDRLPVDNNFAPITLCRFFGGHWNHKYDECERILSEHCPLVGAVYNSCAYPCYNTRDPSHASVCLDCLSVSMSNKVK